MPLQLNFFSHRPLDTQHSALVTPHSHLTYATHLSMRLSKPRLTDQRFETVKPFDLKDELRGSFGLFKGKEKIEVVIEFDAWGADDVRPQHWHWSEELTELPKGRLRVKFTLSGLEEVEKWVLSFGTHATVIEPEALKERVKRSGDQIAAKYGLQSPGGCGVVLGAEREGKERTREHNNRLIGSNDSTCRTGIQARRECVTSSRIKLSPGLIAAD
jgi:hypothetical protein